MKRGIKNNILTLRLSGVMLAVRGQETVPVPLEEIAGVKRLVSPDDPMIISGKRVGTCFGVD